MTLVQIDFAMVSAINGMPAAASDEPSQPTTKSGTIHFATEADHQEWLRRQPPGSLKRK